MNGAAAEHPSAMNMLPLNFWYPLPPNFGIIRIMKQLKHENVLKNRKEYLRYATWSQAKV